MGLIGRAKTTRWGSTSNVPKTIVYTSFALSLVGLSLSVYLTIAHFEGARILACNFTGVFDCDAVTTSAQSVFLHIPVAILGLIFYVVMTGLNFPVVWRISGARTQWLRLTLAAGGMGFALWLVGAELLIIDHFCLYCTGVHIVTFALLVVLSRISPRRCSD